MATRTERPCPHPEKSHYPDRITALLVMAKINKRGTSLKAPKRVYPCCAKGWCLTSKEDKRVRG